MTTDLRVDTRRLRDGAAQLDDAASAFGRTTEAPSTSFDPQSFGTGGAAHEVADRIGRRLRQGAECMAELSRRSERLADTLRETAARFDDLEAALAGGPR